MVSAPAMGLSSQLCFKQLLTQTDLQQAIQAVVAQPANNQLPTMILHGQADGTVAINHSSRAYFHQNQSSQQPNLQLRYYEIERVQHFDALLTYPGFAQHFVPMHPYFEQALDLMYAHLFEGGALPASQLIKTQPRGLVKGQVPALSHIHAPPISHQPAQQILANKHQLEIP